MKTQVRLLQISISVIFLVFSNVLVACQPKLSSQELIPGIVSVRSVETSEAWKWSVDDECASCHLDEADVIAEGSCIVPKGNLGCLTCHNDESGLSSVHQGTKIKTQSPSTFIGAKVSSSVCEACHGSIEDLSDETSTSKALTDSAGVTVNPHSLPINENHAAITCINCHKMHTSNELIESARKVCIACHHTNIYECDTCHDA